MARHSNVYRSRHATIQTRARAKFALRLLVGRNEPRQDSTSHPAYTHIRLHRRGAINRAPANHSADYDSLSAPDARVVRSWPISLTRARVTSRFCARIGELSSTRACICVCVCIYTYANTRRRTFVVRANACRLAAKRALYEHPRPIALRITGAHGQFLF